MTDDNISRRETLKSMGGAVGSIGILPVGFLSSGGRGPVTTHASGTNRSDERFETLNIRRRQVGTNVGGVDITPGPVPDVVEERMIYNRQPRVPPTRNPTNRGYHVYDLGFSYKIHPDDPIVTDPEELPLFEERVHYMDVLDLNGNSISPGPGPECDRRNFNATCHEWHDGGRTLYNHPTSTSDYGYELDTEFIVNPLFGEDLFEDLEDMIPTFNENVTDFDPPRILEFLFRTAGRWSLWVKEPEFSDLPITNYGTRAAVYRIQFNDDMTIESLEEGIYYPRYRFNFITRMGVVEEILESDTPAEAFIDAFRNDDITAQVI